MFIVLVEDYLILTLYFKRFTNELQLEHYHYYFNETFIWN